MDTNSQIVAMKLKPNPGANIAEQNLSSCKASMKELQHREIANQQAKGAALRISQNASHHETGRTVAVLVKTDVT